MRMLKIHSLSTINLQWNSRTGYGLGGSIVKTAKKVPGQYSAIAVHTRICCGFYHKQNGTSVWVLFSNWRHGYGRSFDIDPHVRL